MEEEESDFPKPAELYLPETLGAKRREKQKESYAPVATAGRAALFMWPECAEVRISKNQRGVYWDKFLSRMLDGEGIANRSYADHDKNVIVEVSLKNARKAVEIFSRSNLDQWLKAEKDKIAVTDSEGHPLSLTALGIDEAHAANMLKSIVRYEFKQRGAAMKLKLERNNHLDRPPGSPWRKNSDGAAEVPPQTFEDRLKSGPPPDFSLN